MIGYLIRVGYVVMGLIMGAVLWEQIRPRGPIYVEMVSNAYNEHWHAVVTFRDMESERWFR